MGPSLLCEGGASSLFHRVFVPDKKTDVSPAYLKGQSIVKFSTGWGETVISFHVKKKPAFDFLKSMPLGACGRFFSLTALWPQYFI